MTDPFAPPPSPYGAPSPYGPPSPYGAPWPPAPPPHPLLHANLALGFGLGTFVLGVLSGLPALVFGIKALRSAGRAGGQGKVRAVFGIGAGVTSIAIAVVFVYVIVTGVTSYFDSLANPPSAAENDAALLAAEVTRVVTNDPQTMKFSDSGCEPHRGRPEGRSVTCTVDGASYTVTFGPNDTFRVEPR